MKMGRPDAKHGTDGSKDVEEERLLAGSLPDHIHNKTSPNEHCARRPHDQNRK